MAVSFETVLIANRGEIALRVMRSAAALGYRTVAVYTEEDQHAPHVRAADQAVCIGPPMAYLDADALLNAIVRSGADAVHPGYGFLSENAVFAQRVLDAGVVWIGPPPAAILAMAHKANAKARMVAAGVPCVPGFEGVPDAAAADAVGYPLLVKACAGGGGRGMRRVDRAADLQAALIAAASEAEHAFGDGSLLLERLIVGARHVEVQVVADAHGAVIHLGERDCSLQRRHQKVIEEAPSPAVDSELRAQMGRAACAAARAVDYVGAGTVEFLLQAGEFYFLEMNTRLQVEHPVTELVTGVDLVELQLRIAAGEPLPLAQDQVVMSGHAIEARLYAEDPAAGFLPQPGSVLAWNPPSGIRVDAGVGPTVSSHYDPMLAKLIAHGTDRAQARRRLLRALEATVFFGVRTNRDLLGRLLRHPVFVSGDARTDFLDNHPELLAADAPDPEVLVAALALWVGRPPGFRTAHGAFHRFTVAVDGERIEGVWGREGLCVDGNTFPVAIDGDRVRVGDRTRRYQVHHEGERLWVRHGSTELQLSPWDRTPSIEEAGGDGRITMPMAGRVMRVEVALGDEVDAGQVVAVVEAMKLETKLKSPITGVVREVPIVGDALATGATVVLVEER